MLAILRECGPPIRTCELEGDLKEASVQIPIARDENTVNGPDARTL